MSESPQLSQSASARDDVQLDDATAKDYYFDSYSHFGIHAEMLKDRVRTMAYKRAIMNNKHLFKDKVVLDIGCGTGILCMFAAKAGAKKVIGVDMAGIIKSARQIVSDNGLSDVITLIRGKVEEIELPDGIDKVDIIVSEWMGYFLLYESMLDTVLYARDKWLKEDGIILPDRARIFVGAIEDADYKADQLDFWRDVYGFNMSCMREQVICEPLVDEVPDDALISTAVPVLDVDIKTVTLEQLDFASEFSLKATVTSDCHAICAWFDCFFSHGRTAVHLSTGPQDEYTHWKSTVFYLDSDLCVSKGDKITGDIVVHRNPHNKRDIDITLTTRHKDTEQSRKYFLR
ncbi:MAG: hypothetical protein MHM6MM_003594 [Cercozoa sp. M6MM]